MPRKVIDPHKGTKRYVRRHREARLRNVVEVGWSSKSKRVVKRVAGSRGSQRRGKRKKR